MRGLDEEIVERGSVRWQMGMEQARSTHSLFEEVDGFLGSDLVERPCQPDSPGLIQSEGEKREGSLT